ncbi:MAG: type III secretion system export apparatus subunit SctT [Deltaproteobacteria bacterium]|nr:type III secretion system export apparatus subunit SctT [Deltaproteobacteria bacterium]
METYLKTLGLNINFPFALIMAGLIWARVLSAVMTIPFLFGKPVPRNVRVGASVMLAVFLYPLLVTKEIAPTDIQDLKLFSLFLKEILFGLSIGFAASIVFYGFEGAGQMIDNQRGVSLARILIPELGEQSSITGAFLFQLTIVTFLVLGGHRLFFRAFAESYQVLPLLQFPESVEGLLPLLDLFMKMTGKIFFIAIQISAPVIIAILITDIILGVANRFAPQINVWELGFNIRGYVGILLLFLSLAFIARQIENYVAESNRDVKAVIMDLRGKILTPSKPAEKPPEEELQKPHPVVPL